jgi:nicotinamide-nucleotide amidase
MNVVALTDRLRSLNLRITTAESCTGGLIAAAITDIPGSSAIFDRGYVTYANSAKTELLGVPLDMLAEHGAVSELVARAMAEGALFAANADLAIATTGIAGPDGGSDEKPVGLVWFGLARCGKPSHTERQIFTGDRAAIRAAATAHALTLCYQALAQDP